jgi:ribosomal protein L32
MSVERKCPSCNHWNREEDFCTVCGTILSPEIIEEKREEEREIRRKNVPKTSFEVFIENWENSRFLLFRIIYKILYTIWAIVMGIAFLFAYLTIGSNG